MRYSLECLDNNECSLLEASLTVCLGIPEQESVCRLPCWTEGLCNNYNPQTVVIVFSGNGRQEEMF